MKASRFSDAQKALILKQAADGMPVADVCRKAWDQPGDVFKFSIGSGSAMGCHRPRCGG